MSYPRCQDIYRVKSCLIVPSRLPSPYTHCPIIGSSCLITRASLVGKSTSFTYPDSSRRHYKQSLFSSIPVRSPSHFVACCTLILHRHVCSYPSRLVSSGARSKRNDYLQVRDQSVNERTRRNFLITHSCGDVATRLPLPDRACLSRCLAARTGNIKELSLLSFPATTMKISESNGLNPHGIHSTGPRRPCRIPFTADFG
jgi:hypothetical protein